MQLGPIAISAGYASGLNAYGTVFMLGLLGRVRADQAGARAEKGTAAQAGGRRGGALVAARGDSGGYGLAGWG